MNPSRQLDPDEFALSSLMVGEVKNSVRDARGDGKKFRQTTLSSGDISVEHLDPDELASTTLRVSEED